MNTAAKRAAMVVVAVYNESLKSTQKPRPTLDKITCKKAVHFEQPCNGRTWIACQLQTHPDFAEIAIPFRSTSLFCDRSEDLQVLDDLPARSVAAVSLRVTEPLLAVCSIFRCGQ